MAASLEVRAPFLDYRLVDFVNSIPFEQKMKYFRTKYLLKKLMENKLPKEIIYRKKKGFAVPLAKWFKGELKDFVLDILSQSRIEREGLFNYSYINNLLKEHFKGQKDNRKPIWTLMAFEMWREKW
jgi:asparagine synthase (glutamine-hydrolysing)